MQKHQEWMDNRSYQHHLQCLKKIKARKNHTSNLSRRHTRLQNSRDTHYQTAEKQNCAINPNPNKISRHNSPSSFIQTNHHEAQKQQQKSPQKDNHKNFCKGNKQQVFIRSQQKCFSMRNPFILGQKVFPKNMNGENLQQIQSRDITNISLKQQQLLWNNFLLGKRIMETSPVISKRKLDLDYQKHQQLLKSRTVKKLHQCSNFRLRKLQQHNEKIDKISDDQRIENNLHKQYMVNLLIQSIEIFKFKFSSFQNIIVVMKHNKPQIQDGPSIPPQKKIKQVSECISSAALTSHNFFFTFKKKYFDQNLPIIIEIKNVKSLNVISIGTFSFQFNQNKELLMKEVNLFNFGKQIGTVKLNAHFGWKNEFLSKLQNIQ